MLRVWPAVGAIGQIRQVGPEVLAQDHAKDVDAAVVGGNLVVQAGQVVRAERAQADAIGLRAAVDAVDLVAQVRPLIGRDDDDGVVFVRPGQQFGHDLVDLLVGELQLLGVELGFTLLLGLGLQHEPSVLGQDVGSVWHQDVGEDEFAAGNVGQVLDLSDGEQRLVAMLGARVRVLRRHAGQPFQCRQHRGVAQDGVELGSLAQRQDLVGDGTTGRRIPPCAKVVIAVALRPQECSDLVARELLSHRCAVGRRALHRRRQVVVIAHVQHRRETEVAGMVIGAGTGDDLEPGRLEVGVEVVVDAEPFLE